MNTFERSNEPSNRILRPSNIIWQIVGRFRRGAILLILMCGINLSGAQQLNQNCVVSILNRTAQVKPDGSWDLPNIPANFGDVRARATCVENGVTRSGQSELFTVLANRMNAIPPIVLGPVTPIPTEVTVTAPNTKLTSAGQTTQLVVTGKYADTSSKNLTASSTGTQYLSSNSNLATVSAQGLVTAKQSGTILVQAINEGTQGILQINVALSRDSDGDGILDDVELSLGLNPNNPADGLDDPDRDGLNNKLEIAAGTNIQNPDTDGDSISDGEEAIAGRDGFITNPLLADTDGDGVPDNVEIASTSNPTDPRSVNFAKALKRITVAPANFIINIDSTNPTGSQQLAVTGEFNLGGTIDLTSTARGTNYASSNTAVCNFGAEPGRVFGAADGSCTITVTNSGFTATASGTVKNFTPVALSFVAIPGFANNVDVNGNFAYVAAGSTGLQVVSLSATRQTPQVVAAIDTPGNANDVVLVGNFAYVADGASGLQIINIANPLAPTIVGALDTPGDASDVVVYGNTAYVADGASGLQIIDVTSRASPKSVSSLALTGTARGVDFDPARNIAVIAAGSTGLHVVDISNRASPNRVATLAGGDVRDVVLRGNFAFLADFSRSFTSVDLSSPASPVVKMSTQRDTGGLLMDVAVTGQFATGADVLFVNGVPIISITNPDTPQPRAIINFGNFRDDNGTGVAMDGSYVYMTGERGLGTENGVSGDTRLYIGQYTSREDKAGIPPQVTLTSPANNSSVIRGSTINLRANATDDVAVAAVTFTVNGADVSSDSSEPYEALYTVPDNATTLTIRARAIDLGNNTATTAAVTVTGIADPLTTVSGSVVDSNNIGVLSASVTCAGKSTTSGANGAFSIASVPTIQGDIACSATATVAGVRLVGGTQSVAPVRGGVTNVGRIQLRRPGGGRISAGYLHTCAITPAGGAKCWGYNGYGQLGNGTFADSSTPVNVTGLTSGVIAISAGIYHTCALTVSGAVKCWGYTGFGALGNGNTSGSGQPTPQDVTGLNSGVTAIIAGWYHSCSVTATGGVKCWGYNPYGQAGPTNNGGISPTPQDVSGFSGNAASLAAGFYHTCALTIAGGAKCWGYNSAGALGNGSTSLAIQPTPQDVTGLATGVTAIAGGYLQSCALTATGGAKCWGYNGIGALGEINYGSLSPTPQDVTGLTAGNTAIATGVYHSCAVTSTGGAKCWGNNAYGALGNGNVSGVQLTPQDVTGLTGGITAITANYFHTCALTTTGGAKCWGYNANGALGDGTFTQRNTPVDVVGF
jgi:alpha-tubulin suppressor-like RCC1 family protein